MDNADSFCSIHGYILDYPCIMLFCILAIHEWWTAPWIMQMNISPYSSKSDRSKTKMVKTRICYQLLYRLTWNDENIKLTGPFVSSCSSEYLTWKICRHWIQLQTVEFFLLVRSKWPFTNFNVSWGIPFRRCCLSIKFYFIVSRCVTLVSRSIHYR